MVDPWKPAKSLLKPKPSLPAQASAGPRASAPAGLQNQLQEEIAIREVRQAIANNFTKTFQGARFVPKDEAGAALADMGGSALEIVDGILGDVADVKGYDEFKKGFTMTAQPFDVTMDMAKKLVGTESYSETVQAVGTETLTGLYAAVTPYLGCVKGGIAAAQSLYGAADDVRAGCRAIEAMPIVNTGGPQQALNAVSQLLDRRANDQFTKGTIRAVESIVNTALIASGVASVASSAVSLASKIGVLAVIIRRRGIEYAEMKAGRLALGAPQSMTPAVFGNCPLLGCYLLTGSNTSAVMLSWMATSGGRPTAGWMDQVETNKRFLDPLLGKATEFTTDSIWRVVGPNLSSKAFTADRRPWVERFWISHYGATNRGYRVIQSGKKAAALKKKAGDTLDKLRKPLETVVKQDLQRIAALATSG